MESGIMVAAIAAVIIAVVIAIGGKANNAFEKVNTGPKSDQDVEGGIRGARA